MKKLCNYYYSLSKNNKNIGEQSIDIIRNGNEEFISIELFLIGKKVTVNVKYVDGLLEYYVKNTLESGMLKEEKLNSIQKNEYSFYRNGKEGTIVSGKPLSIYEKTIFVLYSQGRAVGQKVFSEKNIISLESLSTYKIKYFLMENGAYKIHLPEKMMIEYGEDHIFKYSINLENGIEMKID